MGYEYTVAYSYFVTSWGTRTDSAAQMRLENDVHSSCREAARMFMPTLPFTFSQRFDALYSRSPISPWRR